MKNKANSDLLLLFHSCWWSYYFGPALACSSAISLRSRSFSGPDGKMATRNSGANATFKCLPASRDPVESACMSNRADDLCRGCAATARLPDSARNTLNSETAGKDAAAVCHGSDKHSENHICRDINRKSVFQEDTVWFRRTFISLFI